MGGMNRAGAESMIMTLYRVLDKEKYQFDFLVYKKDKQDYEDEIISMGGRVIHLPLKAGLKGKLKSINGIHKIIRDYGPFEAIHIATLHNSAFPLIASIPYHNIRRIVHSHNTSNVVNPGVGKKIYNWITKKIIQSTTQYRLACGKEAGEYLFGKHQFNKDGIIINNSVNVEAFYHSRKANVNKIKAELNLSNKLVIGSIARLTKVKNHGMMIEIASELKDRGVEFKMLLIGRGELESSLKESVNQRGLSENVMFLGVRSDISELLHCMDMLLMPSYFEGNPVTLIEAQAAGVPALISDSITRKIDLNLGLIHQCNVKLSAGVWVDRILSIKKPELQLSQIKRAMAEAGYDTESNLQKLIELYNR